MSDENRVLSVFPSTPRNSRIEYIPRLASLTRDCQAHRTRAPKVSWQLVGLHVISERRQNNMGALRSLHRQKKTASYCGSRPFVDMITSPEVPGARGTPLTVAIHPNK